jgi:riboflavin kinase/FMN adenylyltransferase
MKIHTALPAQKVLERCALSIGTFDGVHRGHRALVESLKRHAAARDLPTAVLTFQDMPHCFFRPDDCPRLLTLPNEKIAAFAELEIDFVFIVPFDKKIAAQNYDDFVAGVLRDKLGAQLLVIGPDFALGKNRAGDTRALKILGEKIGYETQVLRDKIEFAGAAISSTRVRGAVENGKVEDAAQMLGRAFTLSGEVVGGKKLGRAIGVPTINFQTSPRKVLPATGIYAARAFLDDGRTPKAAALSIGTNPTVSEDTSLKLEFHVIDEMIRDAPKTVRVEMVQWLRGEEKFASLDALVAQMQNDIAQAREILR